LKIQAESLAILTSIGDALDAPDHHPVHILYVHGINQAGAGDSALLRESICKRLKLCDVKDWKTPAWSSRSRRVCRRVNPPSARLPGQPGVRRTPTNGVRPRRLLCTGGASPRACLRAGGGRDQLVAAGAFAQVPRRVMVPEAHLAGPHRDPA